MWLSKKMAERSEGGGASARVGGVTIGGENAAVLLSGERRDLTVLAPEGFLWRPRAGTQALVVRTDDGERFLLGVPGGGADFPSLSEGELCLKSGDCFLKLGADGRIDVKGDVYITGRLFLNGLPVSAGGLL